MKKIFLIFITAIVIPSLIPTGIFAQVKLTPTFVVVPSPTKAPSKDIIDFKEKLASQVVKLSQKNKKAVAGIVESVDDKKLKVKTDDEGEFDVKIDPDLTKFFLISGVDKVEKNLSTLKKDAYVIVGGTQLDQTIDGNVIYQDEQFLTDTGKVVAVNTADNSLDVVTLAKENYTLDIEFSTKQQIVNIKTLELERTSFSKIKEGDSIHFVVKKLTKVKNRFSAVRVLIIPQEYFIK